MRRTLLSWSARIGALATDTNETALQKRLTVMLCAGTLPLTALWSVIYLQMHVPLAAVIPAFYTFVTRSTPQCSPGPAIWSSTGPANCC